MVFLSILKYILLVVAIVYTFSNIVKAFRKMAITSHQLFIMAVSIVGYLILQFEIGV